MSKYGQTAPRSLGCFDYKRYLSKLQNAFVWITKFICSNCSMWNRRWEGWKGQIGAALPLLSKSDSFVEKIALSHFPKRISIYPQEHTIWFRILAIFSHFVVPFSCAVWRPLASVNPPKATIVSMMQSSLQLTKQFHNLHFCQFFCQ